MVNENCVRMKKQDNIKSSKKKKSLSILGIGILIILLANIISSKYSTRIDLTAEKRYTLSPATVDMLRNLDDIVYFKVYLEGDFPAGFKRLRNETKDILREFNAYSKNIQFEFIDPSTMAKGDKINAVYEELVKKGLNPTDLHVKEEGGSSQKIIFPGALVSYHEKEVPFSILLSQAGMPAEEVLNNSIQGLEYNISSVIRRLVSTQKPSIAFIEGHGELDRLETYDITVALSEYYKVDRVTLNGQVNSLTERHESDSLGVIVKNKYKALIIARPDTIMSEKDKFLLDQYVMRGGKILWFIDPVVASMDSLVSSPVTVGVGADLNLEDLFFKYGIRLQKQLIMDLSCMPIPITTGSMDGQPQMDFLNWYYFPVLTPISSHPIVNNLNMVRTEFVSPIDTLSVKGVKSTVLLTSSKYSRLVNTPAYISLEILKESPDTRQYQDAPAPVAVLLEGNFNSLYTNRLTPEILNSELIDFKEKSVNTAMIIFADGDIPKNQFRPSDGMPLPTGYDQYTQQTFGNKDFVLNAINYLCDDSGLIKVRSRELKLRLLDKAQISKSKTIIQIINVLIPVLLILLIGIVKITIRKKKYSRH